MSEPQPLEHPVKEFLREGKRPDLVINRVPRKELEWFIAWCDDEFASDFGMGLKWLCQNFMPPENTEIVSAMEQLNVRLATAEMKISKLENSAEQRNEAPKARMSVAGTPILQR